MSNKSSLDREKIKIALKAIEKQYGDGSVYTLDSKKSNLQIPRWSTGLSNLDNILGGGIPFGRLVEISGPESAGKTSLLYHLLSLHEIAVDIPIEGTFDAKRAKSFGCRKGQLIVRQADYGEAALETVHVFADLGVPLIGIDSVPSMIPKKVYEQKDMEKQEQRGQIASMLSTRLPTIVRKCERTMTTLLFINQLRDSMGAMMFGPQTHTPGGWALRHYCSLRLQVNRVKWIKIPNKNPNNSANEEIIGLIMKVKVTKSKVCNPGGECMLSLIYEKGFVPNKDVKEIRAEIMKERREYWKSRKPSDDEDYDDDYED